MLTLYTITLFLSSALLFLVEPMFAKMLLPYVGGTPAVWNTCVVFFQAALLGGYGFAHLTTTRLRPRRQIWLQCILGALPLALLPIRLPHGWAPPASTNPIGALLAVSAITVGAPFLLLATTAPVLQRWYGASATHLARDPYFLYAASNTGSMVGLLSFPFVLEPGLTATRQTWLWAAGYALYVLLMLGCGYLALRQSSVAGRQSPEKGTYSPESVTEDCRLTTALADSREPRARSRFRWIALAFVPSSLMLGLTSYLTTDLPLPLLWVLPLAIYIGTFILVFARRTYLSHEMMVRRMPMWVLLSLIIVLTGANHPIYVIMPIHLVTFFIAAMVCHGELARSRPPARYLTSFYFWISLGGVLGGAFNALIAPMIFKTIVEYPIGLILAAMLRPSQAVGSRLLALGKTPPQAVGSSLAAAGETQRRAEATPALAESQQPRANSADWLWPVVLGALMVALVLGLPALGVKIGSWMQVATFAPVGFICLSFGRRPRRFALGLLAILFAGMLYQNPVGDVLARRRSFFGVYRVLQTRGGGLHLLQHGTTVHGAQFLDPKRRLEPAIYYSPSGPVGDVFQTLSSHFRQVGLIGLGTGCILGYEKSGQFFTYYEIDPIVENLARDPEYFTFLRDAAGSNQVILGDARLRIKDAADHEYDLLVLDAFSSDAIPVHLLTREALQLYLSKLAEDGVILINISNRYLDLRSVVADLASDAGLATLSRADLDVSPAEMQQGKTPSLWVALARNPAAFGDLPQRPQWSPLPPGPHEVWTDEFSTIARVIRLR